MADNDRPMTAAELDAQIERLTATMATTENLSYYAALYNARAEAQREREALNG